MKKALLPVLVFLFFTACANSAGSTQGERFNKNQTNTGAEILLPMVAAPANLAAVEGDSIGIGELQLDMEVGCYPDGIHPIGLSIADQFAEITSYQEVMAWFCNGANFEDILNALVTQEISNVQAEIFLEMIATGNNWDDIWLELGITEQ